MMQQNDATVREQNPEANGVMSCSVQSTPIEHKKVMVTDNDRKSVMTRRTLQVMHAWKVQLCLLYATLH